MGGLVAPAALGDDLRLMEVDAHGGGASNRVANSCSPLSSNVSPSSSFIDFDVNSATDALMRSPSFPLLLSAILLIPGSSVQSISDFRIRWSVAHVTALMLSW
jgi:hypothetical protein